MADLPSGVEPLPVEWSDIYYQNYAEVKRKLSLTDDPNKCIDTPTHLTRTVFITGLEFSVFFQDWKMVLIFLLAGADPDQNLFDGIVREPTTGEPLHQIEALPQMEAFRSEDGQFQSVPGFRGLQCIMDADILRKVPGVDLSQMRATLWLTEQLHENSAIVLGSDMISQARRNCLLLDTNFDWESAFSSKAASCLALSKQISVVCKVPEEPLHSVIEHWLHQLLHGAIRECLEGIVDGIGPGLEEANEDVMNTDL